jgi:hypothetical protein
VKGTCWLAMSGRVEEGPRGALFSVALWWLCLECSPVLLGCCWLIACGFGCVGRVGPRVVLGGVCGWGWCVAWGWFGDRAGGVVRIGWVRIGVIAPRAVRPGTMWNCSPIIVVVQCR